MVHITHYNSFHVPFHSPQITPHMFLMLHVNPEPQTPNSSFHFISMIPTYSLHDPNITPMGTDIPNIHHNIEVYSMLFSIPSFPSQP